MRAKIHTHTLRGLEQHVARLGLGLGLRWRATSASPSCGDGPLGRQHDRLHWGALMEDGGRARKRRRVSGLEGVIAVGRDAGAPIVSLAKEGKDEAMEADGALSVEPHSGEGDKDADKEPVHVIGAGAVYDGRVLAANFTWGTETVSSYALAALIFTSRPLRVRRSPYIDEWKNNWQAEIKELLSKGLSRTGMQVAPWKVRRGTLMGRISSISTPASVHSIPKANHDLRSIVEKLYLSRQPTGAWR
ncbi:hypothetical protein B0H11DRAFT_2255893 [Mycena galericulata]|nr:hypothetical protein B0H11DRAFT_2255893 [Mycena galericulata]